jgi:kinesin family member C1
LQFVLVDAKRAEMLEEIIGLKGNVRVFARVRPFIEGEQAEDDKQAAKDAPAPSRLAVSMAKGKQAIPERHLLFCFPNATTDSSKSIELIEAPAPGVDGTVRAGKKHPFELNRVFNPLSSQADMFKEVEPVVASALDGNKVTVMCYGQTGSGKTFTVLGTTEGEGRGLVPRSAEMVFDRLKTLEGFGWTSSVSACIVEVYNEELKDLLAPASSSSSSSTAAAAPAVAPSAAKNGKGIVTRTGGAGSASAGAGASAGADLEIRHEKGETIVNGLTILPVAGAKDVRSLMEVALAARSTAATNSNANSSRSHCVFTLKITMEHKAAGLKRSGILNLVDLAGSERVSKSGAEGQRLLETQNINKSLSILTQVLFAIKSNASHVPYRSSKLTYLLQESLGGSCKTLLIANLSPSMRSENESLCTLRFASSIAEVGSAAPAAGAAGSFSSSAAAANN